jgi:hypothetical protein
VLCALRPPNLRRSYWWRCSGRQRKASARYPKTLVPKITAGVDFTTHHCCYYAFAGFFDRSTDAANAARGSRSESPRCRLCGRGDFLIVAALLLLSTLDSTVDSSKGSFQLLGKSRRRRRFHRVRVTGSSSAPQHHHRRLRSWTFIRRGLFERIRLAISISISRAAAVIPCIGRLIARRLQSLLSTALLTQPVV